jgi:DNA-binding LytR/AlgR family response regulator
MKVLIIEDEAPAFRRLQKILEEIDPKIELLDVIDSVEESIKWLRHHPSPDLIFMDIQLSDGISFEIFDQVTLTTPIIFTTAFDEYMLRAFKVNSIDYLLKPIKTEDLRQSLAKYETLNSGKIKPFLQLDFKLLADEIRKSQKPYKTRWLLRIGEKLHPLPTEQIAYFCSFNGVVHLSAISGKTYLMDQNLEQIQGELNPAEFFRANRQFILHVKSIAQVERYHKGKLVVKLDPPTKEQVIISAEKAADFKAWLNG